MKIKIVFKKPSIDVERKGMNICATFVPTGSYIDSNVYVNGYPEVKSGETVAYKGYGKSVYATNVWGWGKLAGLCPMQTATQKFAWFERAAHVAARAHDAAVDAGNAKITSSMTADAAATAFKTEYNKVFEEKNVGVEFVAEESERIYWEQMKDAMQCVAEVTVPAVEADKPAEGSKPTTSGGSSEPKEPTA